MNKKTDFTVPIRNRTYRETYYNYLKLKSYGHGIIGFHF